MQTNRSLDAVIANINERGYSCSNDGYLSIDQKSYSIVEIANGMLLS